MLLCSTTCRPADGQTDGGTDGSVSVHPSVGGEIASTHCHLLGPLWNVSLPPQCASPSLLSRSFFPNPFVFCIFASFHSSISLHSPPISSHSSRPQRRKKNLNEFHSHLLMTHNSKTVLFSLRHSLLALFLISSTPTWRQTGLMKTLQISSIIITIFLSVSDATDSSFPGNNTRCGERTRRRAP